MPLGQTPEPSRAPAQVCRWYPVADLATLEATAVEWILAAASSAIQARQQFHLVLAGGETPRGVYLRLRYAKTDWLRWNLYFGDERCLLPDDGGRNSTMAADAWLDHVAIPTSHIHTIPAELGATRAAQIYATALQSIGDFDMVLLGLGDDGHTASLFPGYDAGCAADAADVLAIHDAHKFPTERVSLSAARLSRARQVVFLVGPGKQNALADWGGGKNIPARHIAPATGVDVLFVAGAS